MVDESVEHETLTRWWTHGEYEPQQIVLLQYMGADTWLAADPDGDGDSMDVVARDLFWDEAEAWRVHLEWLESVFYFLHVNGCTSDFYIMKGLSEKIAITNSKLDKGR